DFPENYLCLAWTIVTTTITVPPTAADDGDQETEEPTTIQRPRRVLAVGGETGTLYLLDDAAAECFAAIAAHAEAIRAMECSKEDPSWLFTSGNDVTVKWWKVQEDGAR
ncbi:hypothetical protein HDU93_005671, partial [Gonapodya sp. JEL0774]